MTPESPHPAWRPDAERETVTFGDLRSGDYMTAEDGPQARWVQVRYVRESKLQRFDHEAGEFRPTVGLLTIGFATPTWEGGFATQHQEWTIDRDEGDAVVVDAAERTNRNVAP